MATGTAERHGTAARLGRSAGLRLRFNRDATGTTAATVGAGLSSSDVDAAADSAERLHAHHNRFVRASTQFVEPWNRRSREISAESLDYGEGIYYNSRLHRVSGYRWGAMLQSWWLWLRHLLP